MHKRKEENIIMKKKVLAITMAALMAASLTACGGSAKETTAPTEPGASRNSRGEGGGYHGSRE